MGDSPKGFLPAPGALPVKEFVDIAVEPVYHK
jgi:hypothetical protein